MHTRFRSKIDAWLIVLFAATALLALAAIAFTWGRSEPVTVPLVVFGLGPAVALPLWLIMTTAYSFTETELAVRSGPFRWEIPISKMRAITPTRSALASPALALDRLRIDYGSYESIMVSPADKDGFLERLRGVTRPF